MDKIDEGELEGIMPIIKRIRKGPLEDKSSYQPQIICAICIESLNNDANTIQLWRCGHKYHVACLTKWVWLNSSCPQCRCPIKLEALILNK
jgi:hypothetical protein